MVEHSWKIIDKISTAWKNKTVPSYKAGSWGPKEADALIAKDNRKWYAPKKTIYSALLQNNSTEK